MIMPYNHCDRSHSPFWVRIEKIGEPRQSYISPEFAQQTIAVMEANNAWFISELESLTRKATEATKELAQHRQCMVDRETILTKLKEMTQ